MIEDFLFFFHKHGINKNARFLLAVSGGVDSVVMADLFNQSSMNFGLAHCNFQLRDGASDQDEKLVADLADNYSVPFYSQKFNTQAYSAERKVSIQMAARELRYSWFNTLLDEHSFDFLVTAHHTNDDAETLLFNLIKGTGIKGLRGIKAQSSRTIRPLLSFTKDKILEYAKINNLEWREDASNQDAHYHRNYLRNEVIPLFSRINPSFFQTLETTLEKLKLVDSIYQDEIGRLKSTLVEEIDHGYCILLKHIPLQHSVPLLFELIGEFGFSYDQCRQVLLNSHSGRTFEGEGFILTRDRDYLFINPTEAYADAVLIQDTDRQVQWGRMKLKIDKKEETVEIIRSSSIAQLDFDQLKFPLTLRTWEAGDFFYPLGMKGKKKISDFMIDHKIPLNLKRRVGILCSGKDVVWVVGYRIDERFKISEHTRNVLQLAIKHGV